MPSKISLRSLAAPITSLLPSTARLAGTYVALRGAVASRMPSFGYARTSGRVSRFSGDTLDQAASDVLLEAENTNPRYIILGDVGVRRDMYMLNPHYIPPDFSSAFIPYNLGDVADALAKLDKVNEGFPVLPKD